MKQIFFSLIFLVIISNCFAQGDRIRNQFGVAAVPHYLIRAGIRVDFEKQLNNPIHWIVLAPQFYWFENEDAVYRNYSKKKGAGLNVFHKIFITKNYTKPSGFYGMYGVGFQYYYVESDIYDFSVDSWQPRTLDVYQEEINLCIGYQKLLSSRLFFDVYIGCRAKLNNIRISESDDDISLWDDCDFYPAFVSGFRIGVIFGDN